MSLERLRREFHRTMKLLEERRGKLLYSLCSPVLRRTGRSHHHSGSSGDSRRPNTAAVMVARHSTQCERVQQLSREPTRCPSLEPSGSAKRHKAPPWNQQHSPPQVAPYQMGPGYFLSRSKSKFDVRDGTRSAIDFITPQDEHQSRLQDEEARQSLINQLQQQISDLNLFLEEERLNHRQTKQKADEYLRDRLDKLKTQHKEHAREVKARHREEALKQKAQLDSKFTDYQTTTEDHIRKLAKDVETMHAAFEAYKSGLQDEMHEEWLSMEQQLKKECDQAVKAATQDLKSQLTREKAADRAEAVKEQRRTMEASRKQHKKDMDNVLRKYSKEAAALERLQKTTVELKVVQGEVEAMKGRYQDKGDQLAQSTGHLTHMKARLMDFEQQFQGKVSEVNAKYKDKLQDLMTHNSHLRLLYVDKCGELLEAQSNTTTRAKLQVQSAKETMETLVKSHHQDQRDKEPSSNQLIEPAPPPCAAISPRPFSAPGTPRESQAANFGARETDFQRNAFPEPQDELSSKTERVRKPSTDNLMNTTQT